MDKIRYRNPSKSEVNGHCRDEKTLTTQKRQKSNVKLFSFNNCQVKRILISDCDFACVRFIGSYIVLSIPCIALISMQTVSVQNLRSLMWWNSRDVSDTSGPLVPKTLIHPCNVKQINKDRNTLARLKHHTWMNYFPINQAAL